MNKWEIDVCKRCPELNQRRLDLIKDLDNSLWKMRTHNKFMNKEELNDKEYVFIESELISWGLLNKRERGNLK